MNYAPKNVFLRPGCARAPPGYADGSRNSSYSLNCHAGAMLEFRMLCRITQSSDAHRTESVSVMDHQQTTGVSSRVLDHKLENIFGRNSLLAWNCKVTPSSWTKVTTIGVRHQERR